MRASEAIVQANDLRPNTISDEQKAQWVYEIDYKVAEMMGEVLPVNRWPEDYELLMPNPYDNIYPLYVIAMIDYYNQESTLYANDHTMFNVAYGEASAWWRRNHDPKSRKNWVIR